MEPVPVVTWAPSIHTSQTARSAVVTGGATTSDMALTKTITMLKSLLPVLHPHRFSFIIVTAVYVLQLFGR